MKMKVLSMILIIALLLCGCGIVDPNATETVAPTATDAPTTTPEPSTVPPTVPPTAPPATQPEATTAPSAPKETTVPPTETTAATQAPKVSITKNPTGETVTEGEKAVFIARADHAEKIVWIAVSPDTKTTYQLDKVPDAFEGLKIDGQGTERLTLSNIPYAMDGWRIQCFFTGNGGPAYTKGAYITVKKAAVKVDLSSFEGIIAQYKAAIQGKYNPAQMMELGLNGMIPECLNQDERAQVGYSIVDMDGDGQKELVISASSESEFYTGLVFSVYVQENGKPKLLLESTDRDRWYYAGDGKLLNTSSGGATESEWYLCAADRKLTHLDAVKYNAGKYPDDPWLKLTGTTWEHIKKSEADQKIKEFTDLVSNMEMTNLKVDLSSFEAIIAQYQAAIQGKYNPARMMELGLNGMIPECLSQDERAKVGYSIVDMDGDGQKELVISASSESEYYTGLIFALYVQEDGKPKLLLESTDRDRWYYAGKGKLLNTSSTGAMQSQWLLCTANRELAYLDGVEYNAGEHPDDPWLRFTGSTWEHIKKSEADQKVLEFSYLVSNMEITKFGA